MIKFIILLLAGLLSALSIGSAQERRITDAEVDIMIGKIVDSIQYYYVNLEEAKVISDFLVSQKSKGKYYGLFSQDSLAARLTKDLRKHNQDQHLYVSHKQIGQKQLYSKEYIESKGVKTNYGITEIKINERNIAIVRISHFSIWNNFNGAKKAISSMIEFIQNADGVVFDVRNNPGGVPHLVSFLISHFLPNPPIKLADYYHRYNDSWHPLFTSQVNISAHLLHQPVFIWVNQESASAAEEFAYWMKHHDRAIIVGDTTAGAGYGAMWHRLNDEFIVSISSEEDINPITGTNFEGTGVIPHYLFLGNNTEREIMLLVEKEVGKSVLLRKNEEYRWQKEIEKRYSAERLTYLDSILTKGVQMRFSDEEDINALGYKYLYDLEDNDVAEFIFSKNTTFFPFSANVYDSYAEALIANGKINKAKSNLETAVQLARLTKHPNLKLFQDNLAKIDNDK